MLGPRFGFAGFVTVPPPVGGFWRVSSWHAPLDPPDPAPPLGPAPQADEGNRYDDPAGRWRTLYCATEAEGALGECLGDFKYNPDAAERIERFLDGDPDGGFDEDYFRALTAEDIKSFHWKLARAPARSEALLIDVNDWRTHNAVAPKAIRALARYGVQRLDRKTLLDERRSITRTLAGVYRAEATDPLTGRLRAAGLRFESRLAPAWECWALWEPLPLDAGAAHVEEVTIDTPGLRLAAEMLGVVVTDG